MTDVSQCRCMLDTVVKRHLILAWFVMPDDLGTVQKCAREIIAAHGHRAVRIVSHVRHMSATHSSFLGCALQRIYIFH